MARKFEYGKIIGRSRCRYIKDIRIEEPYYCKVILTENELIFLHDDMVKDDELYNRVPFNRIKSFRIINEVTKRKTFLKSMIGNVVGLFMVTMFTVGFYYKSNKIPDLLELIYVNDHGELENCLLDMLEYGNLGITLKYNRLIQKKNKENSGHTN